MPQNTADELQPGERFAKYTIERKLGRGGFGAVYLVENDLGMRFALKVLHTAVAENELNRKRFLREMHIAMGITHENSVPVRDADLWKNRLYYTMDYIQGRPLNEVLQEKPDRRVHPVRAFEWCGQVLRYLEFLHQRGFVHRDLKPANLMLEVQGGAERIRVLDLGIAKALTPDDGATVLTAGLIVGTPAYMAPEHLCGDEVDRRADLYAIGVILYECLAGCRPFEAPTLLQLRQLVLDEPPPALPELVPGFPRAVWDVIARALAKDREKRFPDAATFRSELAAAMRVLPREWERETSVTIEAPGRTSSPRGRRTVLLTLGGFLLAGMAVAGWKLIGGLTASKPPRLEVVEPPHGRLLAGREVELGLRIAGSGPFFLRQAGATRPLEESGDGIHRGRLIVPEHDGAHVMGFEVVDQSGAVSAASLEVVVDRSAPREIDIEPTTGTRLETQVALVTVTADEPLGEGTRIGESSETAIEGERASARIEGSGTLAIPIVLFDRLGNRFEDTDYELQFALSPPIVTVLSPLPGTVLAGESVSVRFQVVGPGVYTARVGDLAVELDENGRGEAVLPLPKEGPQQIVFSVAERDSLAPVVVEKIEVTVDRTPPEATHVTLEPSEYVMPDTEISLKVTANEDLGAGTEIEVEHSGVGGISVFGGNEITAKFKADPRMRSVHVILVDRAANRSEFDHPLQIARVPIGFKIISASRPDPRTGWVTPLLEPRTAIELVFVPPTLPEGFDMGAIPGDNDARADEKPRHRVVLSSPYYLGRTEVTWEQLFAGKSLGAFRAPETVPDEVAVEHWLPKMEGGRVPADFPCVSITWEQATEFCRHFGMQLPTEAQWEWACRQAAPTGLYAWDYDFHAGQSWGNVSDQSAAFGKSEDPPARFNDGFFYAAPARGFQTTELGLVHLTGNVLEWCRDSYDEGWYGRCAAAGVPAVDPVVVEWRGQGNPAHALRGGAFRHGAVDCRMTRRFSLEEQSAADFVGFRVCLEVDPR